MIFDGRKFAREIEGGVSVSVSKMTRKPKIVSILVGSDLASQLYTRLKQEAATRVGIDFEVVRLDTTIGIDELISKISEMGSNKEVSGVMVQLPLPENFKGSTLKVLEAIPLGKDVDGLRWEVSNIKPATVASVLSILDEAVNVIGPSLWKSKFVVMGAKGAVGKPLVYYLREKGVNVGEVEWDTQNSNQMIKEADVLISCVGKAGLVTPEMIKNGIVAIDVGMSQVAGKVVGDMTSEVYQKASFAVPVPGGVGPVTIASLLVNVVEIYDVQFGTNQILSKR